MADILASVSIVLGAEVSQFQAAMATARRELKGLQQFAESTKGAGESLTKYLSLPLAALGGASLKVGGDFQAAFNRVQAATQAAGAGLAELRAKAQGIALDPKLQFSSVQAAQALEGLAKNGLSTAQILGGAADATTALATATGAQLATAADITTDVMNNFGRSAQQAAGLVSNITGTTIASKLAIDDYRQALGQAGAVAGQLGVSFEDFNTALGVTSSGFASGSDAGTSFKTFLQRLVPQSKEAEQAIQQLGLHFFDLQGKLRPLREIAGQLQQAFTGLSDQQKNTLGTKIFGADSIRTALLLAKDGTAGFDQMAASIAKVNAAAQGNLLNQGFVGAFEAFKSSLEGLGQAIADNGILDFATSLAQQGAALASSLAQADPAVLQLGVALGGIAAATGPVLVGLGTLGVALPNIKAGLVAVESAVTLLRTGFVSLLNPTTLAIAGLAALAGGAYYLATESERAYHAFLAQSAATQKLVAEVSPLLDRYDALRAKTTLTAAEQAELKTIIEQVTAALPSVGRNLDAYGNYLGLATSKARELITANQGLEKAIALKTLPAQQQKLADLEQQYANLLRLQKGFNETGQFKYAADDKTGYAPGTKELIEFRTQLEQVNAAVTAQQKVVAGLGGVVKGAAVDYALFNETYRAYQARFYAGNGGLTTQLGLLEALKTRLKEVQDQREKETTVGAVQVDNAEITSLQKQIAALEGTDKAARQGADAVTRLRQELARLTALDHVLGDTPNQAQVLVRRADTLEKGLKTLVDNGVSTSSKAFKELAKDFVDTSQAAERLLAGISKNKPAAEQLALKPVAVKSLIPQTIGDTLAPDVARLLGDYAKQTKPFELPVAARLNMEAINEAQQPVRLLAQEFLALSAARPNWDGFVPKALNTELLTLGKAFQQINGAAQLFGGAFDEAAAKAEAMRTTLQNLLAQGTHPANQGLQELAAQYRAYAQEAAVTQAATAAVKGSITALASGLSESIAGAMAGTATLSDGLQQALLGTVGTLATELGQILLASGLGIEALKVSLKSFTGVGAIAAGLGLLAIGGIAKGAMSNLGNSAGSVASGGSLAPITPKVSNYGQNSNTTQKLIIETVVRLRGQDLIAIGRQQTHRSKITD